MRREEINLYELESNKEGGDQIEERERLGTPRPRGQIE
jgi:hypothetical protein